MKKIYVIASTKGGVGKTTIAWHIMPAIFDKCEILEIDNNNNSNIFSKSGRVKKAESITVAECSEKLVDLTFSLLSDTDEVLIIDCGGGDDTKEVLSQIKELDLKGVADITYIVPVMNSLMQARNAEDMKNLLKDEDVIFALNGITDFAEIKNDWKFWFGSEGLGIESYKEKLNNPKTIYIPHSAFFELAALKQMTIEDFVKDARKRSLNDYRSFIFKQYGNDKESFKKVFNEYRQKHYAKELLNSFIDDVKKVLGGVKI